MVDKKLQLEIHALSLDGSHKTMPSHYHIPMVFRIGNITPPPSRESLSSEDCKLEFRQQFAIFDINFGSSSPSLAHMNTAFPLSGKTFCFQFTKSTSQPLRYAITGGAARQKQVASKTWRILTSIDAINPLL